MTPPYEDEDRSLASYLKILLSIALLIAAAVLGVVTFMRWLTMV